MEFILIDTNSDLESDAWPVDSEDEVVAARVALREAGLEYAFVWVGDPHCPDAYKTARKLYAANGADS